MITVIAVIVVLAFCVVLALLGYSYLEHRKDIVEKENHFRDFYK